MIPLDWPETSQSAVYGGESGAGIGRRANAGINPRSARIGLLVQASLDRGLARSGLSWRQCAVGTGLTRRCKGCWISSVCQRWAGDYGPARPPAHDRRGSVTERPGHEIALDA